jgi:hypothetical protein
LHVDRCLLASSPESRTRVMARKCNTNGTFGMQNIGIQSATLPYKEVLLCAHTSAHTSRIFQTVARNSCGIPDHASLRRVSSTQYTWCNAMRPMLASSTPTASVTYDIPRSTLGVASRVLNLCSRRGTGAEPDGVDGGGSIELPEPLLLVAAVASSTAPIACSVSNEALHAIIASTREREIERDCHNIAHNQQGGQQRLGTSTPNSRHANRDTSTR